MWFFVLLLSVFLPILVVSIFVFFYFFSDLLICLSSNLSTSSFQMKHITFSSVTESTSVCKLSCSCFFSTALDAAFWDFPGWWSCLGVTLFLFCLLTGYLLSSVKKLHLGDTQKSHTTAEGWQRASQASATTPAGNPSFCDLSCYPLLGLLAPYCRKDSAYLLKCPAGSWTGG